MFRYRSTAIPARSVNVTASVLKFRKLNNLQLQLVSKLRLNNFQGNRSKTATKKQIRESQIKNMKIGEVSFETPAFYQHQANDAVAQNPNSGKKKGGNVESERILAIILIISAPRLVLIVGNWEGIVDNNWWCCTPIGIFLTQNGSSVEILDCPWQPPIFRKIFIRRTCEVSLFPHDLAVKTGENFSVLKLWRDHGVSW